MKKFILLLCAVVVFSLPIAESTMGDMIVDTGPPDGYFGAQWIIAPYTWLAGQFTINQAYDINAMQGYILTHPESSSQTGQFEVIIFSDNNGLPGTPLFGSSFQPQPSGFYGWQGTSGYSGSLPAGTYWIAFGASYPNSDGGMLFGAMGSVHAPTDPMSGNAVYNTTYAPDWHSYNFNLEVRIEGIPRTEPLPEPSLPTAWPPYWFTQPPSPPGPLPPSVILLGSGLLGLVGCRRFRKG
jgi:hypothetical protein